MFHAKILCQNLRHSSFWTLQTCLWFLHSWSLIFVDCSPHMFNILRCSACGRPSRTWLTFNRFSTIFEVFVPHFYLCCTHCIVPESLLNHSNCFHRGMFKLNPKSDVNLLLYLIILNTTATQYTCSLNDVYHPPLTSTVKSSLITHAHSSPLSLAARLHQCHANHSHYINNGWTFYGQNVYVSPFIKKHVAVLNIYVDMSLLSFYLEIIT